MSACAVTMNELLQTARIRTKDGVFEATFSQRGLCRLEFPQRRASDHPSSQLAPDGSGQQVSRWMALTEAAVNRILEGKPAGELPPLDLSEGTEFQQAVWRQLIRIERGRTTSYSEVAVAVRRPKAARAVGQACGANPVPLLVPCHRVLAAGGKIGGFSGGLDWKRLLLAREAYSDLFGSR